MGTLVRKMEQNAKTVGLVLCSVCTDRCHMMKDASVWKLKPPFRREGLKSDVFKLSCDMSLAVETPLNYVEED